MQAPQDSALKKACKLCGVERLGMLISAFEVMWNSTDSKATEVIAENSSVSSHLMLGTLLCMHGHAFVS